MRFYSIRRWETLYNAPDGLVTGALYSRVKKPPLSPVLSAVKKNIPAGIFVHNIECVRTKEGKSLAEPVQRPQIMAKEGKYVTLKMPSGEMRSSMKNAIATIGVVSNKDTKISVLEKQDAVVGGRRPHVGVWLWIEISDGCGEVRARAEGIHVHLGGSYQKDIEHVKT